MRVTGGLPTGLGNEAAFLAGSPSFQIGPRSPFKGMPQEELNKLKEWDQDPKSLQEYHDRLNAPGPRLPRLPFAGFGGGSPLVAQVYPGGQPVGNQAGMLGAPMQMGPTFGPKPFNLDANVVTEGDKTRLESIGGSANIQLDPNQALRLGANFIPGYTDEMGMQVPQQFGIKGQYETPGFGINVNYRNRGRMPGPSMGGGFPGQIDASFQGRF